MSLSIDPHRAHSTPLATLYHAPERDPTYANDEANVATAAPSPSRSLLAAFQAASPRYPNAHSHSRGLSTSALGLNPSLSDSNHSLQPASPISSSLSHPNLNTLANGTSTNSNNSIFASGAFRALNGASPNASARDHGSRSPSGSVSQQSTRRGSVSASPSRPVNGSIPRQERDQPTWTVYKDPPRTSGSVPPVVSNVDTYTPQDEIMFGEGGEDILDDEEEYGPDQENQRPLVASRTLNDVSGSRLASSSSRPRPDPHRTPSPPSHPRQLGLEVLDASVGQPHGSSTSAPRRRRSTLLSHSPVTGPALSNDLAATPPPEAHASARERESTPPAQLLSADDPMRNAERVAGEFIRSSGRGGASRAGYRDDTVDEHSEERRKRMRRVSSGVD